MEVITKICTKCQEVKTLEYFYWQKNSNKYRNDCKQCCGLVNKQWQKDNPEKHRISNRKYYHDNTRSKLTLDNLQHMREYSKEWQKNNPEYLKEWQKNNHEKRRNCRNKRRALIKNSTVENVDLLQLYKDHKYICGICGLKIDKKLKYPNPQSISLDHVIPLSKSGGHTYDNIQPAHLVCNIRKHNHIDNMQLRLQTI